MSRIRTIKPEFFSSPDTAKASLAARLLYIGMWCHADDTGRGELNYKQLEGETFPNDDLSKLCRGSSAESVGSSEIFRELVAEVADVYGLEIYSANRRVYYWIPAWEEHQRNERKAKSKYPAPEDGTPVDLPQNINSLTSSNETVTEILGSSAQTHGSSVTGTGEQGNRGTGEQYSLRSTDVETRKGPKPTTYPDDFERFWTVYPAKRDKRGALKAFRDAKKRADVETIIAGAERYAAWCAANPERKIKYPQGWLNGDRWTDDLTSSDGGEKFDPYRALANAVQQQSNFRPLPAGGDQWQ